MFMNPLESTDYSCIFVIFGGTGDLTKRKLMPAFYNLLAGGSQLGRSAVVSVGRRGMSDEAFREYMYAAVKSYSRLKIDDTAWAAFSGRVFYRQFDFSSDIKGYSDLNSFLCSLDRQFGTNGNRIFYLAVAPGHFDTIVKSLYSQGMLEQKASWQRVMIEKPFGSGLNTARKLNDSISEVLGEENIFRVDHYLGKEMIQNILTLRFANSLFEPLWNQHYIDNIQITSSETLGIEERGGYYESSGILKDMLQNHLLQMLTLIAMEPPVRLEPECIRDEKVKVLRSLRPFDGSMAGDVVRGQYGEGAIKGVEAAAYRKEEKVSPDSDTDTFIALKVFIDNFRWGGVPFYIRSGKRLNRKTTEIAVEFKKLPGTGLFKDFEQTGPNLLVFEIQPREGFFFRINAKKPGSDFLTEEVRMDYCQSCRIGINSPEAYERLLLECARNNAALFTRWDELELSWSFVDGIEKVLREIPHKYPNYAAGSRGPEEALELVRRDGRVWWDNEEEE